MAEIEGLDYEVKDEELVDFEESDYGFGSDEELEIDEEIIQPTLIDFDRNGLENTGDRTLQSPSTSLAPGDGDMPLLRGEQNSLELWKGRGIGTESGEIEEDKEDKEDGIVMQPLSSSAAPNRISAERRVGGTRRKYRKADLEDGELDDAAMPEGSDHEAEGKADDEDEAGRRERKRRKERFAAERQSENVDQKDRSFTFLGNTGRQHRLRGSDRPLERSGGFVKSGPRGTMPVGGFHRTPSMTPGMFGPGHPMMMPVDIAAMPLRPMARGFLGPFSGVQMAGRGNVHVQEAMVVHEHMLHPQQMMQHLVHANSLGPGRHPLIGPIGGPAVRPLIGIEIGGPIAQGIMHLQPPCPDIPPPMNFAGSVDPPRNQRPGFGTRGPSGSFSQVGGTVAGSSRNGIARLAAGIHTGELVAVGRARGRGRWQGPGPLWGDPHVFLTPTASAHSGLGPNIRPAPNSSTVQGRIVDIPTGLEKTRQVSQNFGSGHHFMRGVRNVEPIVRVAGDGSRRLGGENSAKSSVHFKNDGDVRTMPADAGGTGNKLERDDKFANAVAVNRSKANATIRGHGIANGSTVASNLIQLGGPVLKSRVLSVSGLPENTSMSVVVEVFEKQGKVTDFKKEDRGDSFTITFASVSEAISAQRHLHRSILAGRQITVEYAV